MYACHHKQNLSARTSHIIKYFSQFNLTYYINSSTFALVKQYLTLIKLRLYLTSKIIQLDLLSLLSKRKITPIMLHQIVLCQVVTEASKGGLNFQVMLTYALRLVSQIELRNLFQYHREFTVYRHYIIIKNPQQKIVYLLNVLFYLCNRCEIVICYLM